MPKRHVRKPARPSQDFSSRTKGSFKRFLMSFSPRNFRSYWLSRDGAKRVAKLAGAGLLFVFLVFLWFAKDLPTPGKINARVTAQTTKFYDSTGNKLIYELYGDQNRSIVAFDQIPAVAKQATIAIEDKDFYRHGSFSFVGYLRAAFVDLTKGRRQGGSTITQQYVKNALLDPTDRSISRKIKELILSIEIGQFYSKNDILTLYLNEIPYGNRAYGIESACKTFFPQDIDKADRDQHCAKNLTLSQSALLASILNAPSYFSPFGAHQPQLIDRQHIVLDLMAEQKYVTQAEADAAKWKVADLSDAAKISQIQNLYANLDPRLAHFVLYAQDYLESKYGTSTVTEGGLNVRTTLDYDKQIAAYDAIQNNMKNVRSLGGSNAALVSTDPKSGHILAMIGSQNFNDPVGGQVNVATAQRQPGSSFKPIVYSTLFGKNKDAACAKTRDCPTYGPGTTIYDVPTNFGTDATPYKPQNFGNKNYGIITVRQALAGSLNVPAVKALAMAGISSSLQTAQALGISTLNKPASEYGLSLVLGTGGVQLNEMANAYESFANGGLHYEQTPILLLKDQKGNILEDNTKPKKPKQALSSEVAGLMADVLSDTSAKQYVFGDSLSLRNVCSNNRATGCVHAGVKTGTTEHFNDAWTMGFTPDVVGGVWVGNNDNSPMSGAAANIAAPIWRTFMNAVQNGTPNDAFAKPSTIKTITLDKTTGRSVSAGTKNSTVDIFPSWYTPMGSFGGKSAQVDKVSGLLATECTPELAKNTVYSSAILPEITKTENPSQFQNWLVALQRAGYSTSGGDLPSGTDNVHHCDDVKPVVAIAGATGGGPYSFNVKVTSGTFTSNKLEVYFDDQIISTQVIDGSGSYPVSYSPTTTGSHTFKAVVTDAGLYQGSDDQAVTVTNIGGSASSFKGVFPADGAVVGSGPINFAWSVDPGAGSYSLYVDDILKATTSGIAKSVSGISTGDHIWYIRSDIGGETTHLSFTK